MRVNNLFGMIAIALVVALTIGTSTEAQQGLYGAPQPLVFNMSASGQSTPLGQFNQNASPQLGVVYQQPQAAAPYNTAGYRNQPAPRAGGTDWINSVMSPAQNRYQPINPAYGQDAAAAATGTAPAQLQPAQPQRIPTPAQPGPDYNALQPPNQTSGSFLLDSTCSSCGGAVYDGTCGSCGECCETSCLPRCCPWYGSVTAFYMTRNQPDGFWSSANFTHEEDQIFKTDHLDLEWKMGGEIRFGRRFCCNVGCGCECVQRTWALEAAYWTLEPFDGYRSITAPGSDNLVTPINLSYVPIDGTNLGYYFDNSPEHRVWRHNEMHSVEINLLSSRVDYFTGPSWNVDWLVGLRYSRFNERLVFGGVSNGNAWGDDPPEQAYIDEWVDNNLFGVQFGVDASYCWQNRRLSVHFRPRVGLYNNSINQNFAVYDGDGVSATQSIYNLQYPVKSSRNTVSFMTQLDMGLGWEIFKNCRLTCGYRVVVLTGMGLADNQVPAFLLDTPEIRDIASNANLVLHGGYAGLEFNF